MRIDSVSHCFGDRTALSGVSFDLERGTSTGLVGVNGAGKSTLLTIMAGARKPSSGRVTVDADDLYERRGRRRGLKRVALMPQEAVFPGALTALEVVEYVAWMRSTPHREIRRASVAALDSVGMADHARRRMSELSGGMRRRVALAQAVVDRPDVLLLDEPSTGLDPRQRKEMVDLVKNLDATVLISSHIMEDITDIADRLLVLDSGELLFDGSVQSFLSLSPADTPTGREAESAFLSILTSRGAG